MNVLVYSGSGTATESVNNCLYTLRRLLFPNYAVSPVTSDALLNEPWASTCALLVIPGGVDSDYCSALNGAGNRLVSQFVHEGGAYLGFSAGGYYGSERCEFEVGKEFEVVGDRELAFFPGICRGAAFKGFIKNSQEGAKATELRVEGMARNNEAAGTFRCYYNGGGVFVSADKYAEQGVEVLARFTEDIAVDSGTGKAAVVYCKVNKGSAILSSPHLEFVPANLDTNARIDRSKILDRLLLDDEKRENFLKACLKKLCIKMEPNESAILTPSLIHVSSLIPSDAQILKDSWREIITLKGEEEYIQDTNDLFHLVKYSTEPPGNLIEPLPGARNEIGGKSQTDVSQHDPSGVVTRILVRVNDQPAYQETPFFDHNLFYSSLHGYQFTSRLSAERFGKYLMMSTVYYLRPAPKAVKSYGEGYSDVPVRLKWPNDIYVEDPSKLGQNSFVKVGGILVQCSGDGKQYYLAVDALNIRLAADGQPCLQLFTQEKLLARILVVFEELYIHFCENGWTQYFEDMYYKHWLHSNQIITLETLPSAPRARVLGITRDWALLRTEELDEEGGPTGKIHDLQPDGNRFDFFRGLVTKKT
ncbi:hypothetical protein GP486_003535 [Trichoglossum hirsutum]|uniref:Uncharacterized protein n=1 Tax=Trichoglossum hirsutum TaxID=265104 RepID=A0A9P8LCX5_9PEZI|nr:hypothetical protein GP486_003535 [Trichoglossum hirsutum]